MLTVRLEPQELAPELRFPSGLHPRLAAHRYRRCLQAPERVQNSR